MKTLGNYRKEWKLSPVDSPLGHVHGCLAAATTALRQTQTDTDRHRQTQTDTDRHRQTQTDTDRHRLLSAAVFTQLVIISMGW